MEQTAGQTMGQTTTEPNTTEILLDLLKRAAQAHEFTRRNWGSPIPTGRSGTPST